MMMRSAFYQTNTLSWILIQGYLTETTFCRQTCRPIRTYYPDSEPTGLCSFSLMLRAQRRSNKYQFYSLWFDPTGTRTHDLLHRHLFHSKNIYPFSSLLQGKHLPFSPSPLRLTIFRLFVILLLTQLYRYIPKIFLVSTATFKYTPSDELNKNIQRKSHFLFFSH